LLVPFKILEKVILEAPGKVPLPVLIPVNKELILGTLVGIWYL
jgi:hypothetical protein